MSQSPVINIADVALEDFGGKGMIAARLGRMGPALGAKELGCMLTVTPPGKAAFPFHNHHAIEELVIVLEGEGELRLDNRTDKLKAGDVVSFPAGEQDAAHQIVNTGVRDLKYLCVSTMPETDIVEYPDSGKFRAVHLKRHQLVKDAPFHHLGRKADEVDFWEGEV
jgi:uncharacterized cupin superfamily protein